VGSDVRPRQVVLGPALAVRLQDGLDDAPQRDVPFVHDVQDVQDVHTEKGMPSSISVSEAREGFADLVNRVAYARERVRVVRRGRELAAIVPMEDIELFEAIENELDLAAARDALADPDNARRIGLDELRARLAL